ncbi:protein FxsA [Marinibactrum halimedae]|uniref:Protein FxsA n=1 Tax=Marinibactrum halimedae TaxID=1444977 RepID=A0AA37T4N2_9GAMM|nr:protein FxsA [Marinibactrum halimedae]
MLVKVGTQIGVLSAIGLSIFTAFAGIHLVRMQGLKTLATLRERMQANELPGVEIIGAISLAIAGVLLLIPGFVSDAVGVLFLIPGLRVRLAKWLLRGKIQRFQQSGAFGRRTFQGESSFFQTDFEAKTGFQHGAEKGGTTIDGECEEEAPMAPKSLTGHEDSDTPPPHKKS